MPDLRFRVEGAQAVAHAASPLVSLRLHISNAASDPIHAVLLRCQVQIEAPRRAVVAGLHPGDSGRRRSGSHPALNPLHIFGTRFALHFAAITRGPLAVCLLANGRDQ